MRSIPVTVDSHLRLDGNLIGHDLANAIFDELTIHNNAKDIQERMQRWGWEDLPDEFCLGELDGDTVVMPRGYACQLKLLLREHDLRVQWEDRRMWRRGPAFADGIPLKPHQTRAVHKMALHQQGMYEAPTGSGKTVSCIGLIVRKRPLFTLILVDKKDLLYQWRKELAKWLAVDEAEIGQIGDGIWRQGARITVATVQSIWKVMKEDELPDFFFSMWDCVILDECHHVTARTLQEILNRFWAKLRMGVSATTDRVDGKFEFALLVLGEVFQKDSETHLRRQGVLMRPRVQVVRTQFEHAYWGDHESDEDDKCEVPGCRLSGRRRHFHRNNYMAVKKLLVNDDDRNRLVIDTLLGQIDSGDHHHLIVSDEVGHLDALRGALSDALRRPQLRSEAFPAIYTMTGKVKGTLRVEMKAAIERGKAAVIFATVAKEGLDIPAIDRIYLPFPSGNAPKIQQWIGRGTRTHEGKQDIIVFDFFDYGVDIFRKQFRRRRFKCYDRLKLEVDLGK